MAEPTRPRSGRSRRRRRPRIISRRAAAWMVVVVAAGVGFDLWFALRPAYIEARLRRELQVQFGEPVDFDTLELSFSRGIEVGGLRLESDRHDDTAPICEVRRLRVVPRLLDMILGRIHIEEVVLVQPVLHVSRSANGRWNIGPFLDLFDSASDPRAAGEVPAVRIEDGRVVYSDSVAGEYRQEVSELWALVRPRADGGADFEAELRAAAVRSVRVTGRLAGPENSGPKLSLHAVVSKVDLVGVRASLPPAVREKLGAFDIQGVADVYGDFVWSESRGFEIVRIAGEVLRCDVDHPRMPWPARGFAGRVSFGGRLLRVDCLGGLLGGGACTLDAELELDGQTWEPVRWTLDVRADSIPIDRRLRAVLPEEGKLQFDLYRPGGRIGVALRIADSSTFPPALEDISGKVELQDVEMAYALFPYPVESMRGELKLERGWIRIPRPIEVASGTARGQVVGAGIEIHQSGLIDLAAKIYDAPLDERFRSCIPESSRSIWDDFRLSGFSDGVIRIHRDRGDERPPSVVISAFPRGLSIAYRHFPYPITDITGEVEVDLRGLRMSFVDLKGSHGDTVITGDGAVELRDGGLFLLDLHTDHMTVDDELKAALSSRSRKLLSDFRFRGEVGVDVTVRTEDTGEITVRADVDLLKGIVEHVKFPYRFELESGRLVTYGDHTLEFRELGTPVGFAPHIVLDGEMTTEGARHAMGFRADVENFEFDRRLIDALPPQLARFVRSMKLGGRYDGKLRGSFEFDEFDADYLRLNYSGDEIVARDAEVSFGLTIRDIAATGNFVGVQEPGRPHALIGRIDVDSSWFNRLQLKDFGVSFAFGEEHEAVLAAQEDKPLTGTDYRIPDDFVARLRPDRVADTFQALLSSDDLYGGRLDGFLYLDGGEENDLAGHLVSSGIQIGLAAEDVFGADGAGTEGVAGGWVKFRGRAGDVNSIVGKGEGAIGEARLAQLPLFLGLIGALFGDATGGHFFKEVLLRFDIVDGKFDAGSDGIDIKSAGIKLRGGGTMDFDGELDLSLLPRIFDVEIIGLEQLFGLIKEGTARVAVKGELEDPKVEFVTGLGAVRIGLDGEEDDGPKERLPSDLRGGGTESPEGASGPQSESAPESKSQ